LPENAFRSKVVIVASAGPPWAKMLWRRAMSIHSFVWTHR
jgi:hypothetical protein